MIDRLISWSLHNRTIVAIVALFLAVCGAFQMKSARVDAIPDLSENQVIVFADWPGRSPQEVEDQITYPLSTGLQGLAGVKTVRASSMFGFSFVTVIFEDSVDNYFARSRILEKLNYIGEQLPEGAKPQLGPDASGLGWIYQYYLRVDPAKAPQGGYDLATLRSIQDWQIRYQLNGIPGVSEVGSLGGFVRQYQVDVNPAKLRFLKVGIREVSEALEKANANIGGKTLDEGKMEFIVRGIGRLKNIEDIENVVIKGGSPSPIRVRDVARVVVGGDFRRGALDFNGSEAVGGVIVMRNGGNCREILEQVRSKVTDLNSTLPAGLSIQPFYDRGQLIDRAVSTLRRALVEEVVLVALAHILFLWHFRSIIAVTLPLPLAILGSFILMRYFGVASNIMSLGGLAIAIGVLVDAGIVVTENVIRHFETLENKLGRPLNRTEAFETTLLASKQVGRPVFFAMVIILLAFMPVFVLSGEEGKMFHPLALTKTFAMALATVLSVTLVPALCTVLVRGPFKSEEQNWIMNGLLTFYKPVLRFALGRGKLILSVSLFTLGLSLALVIGLPNSLVRGINANDHKWLARLVSGVGSEFMPTLNEGSYLYMPVLPPSLSITEIKRIVSLQDQILAGIPEVQSAAGKLGRSETATDPAPVEMIETTIELKPSSEWRKGKTQEDIVNEINESLSKIPGCVPGLLHPIEGRILMLNTGIRAQFGVKVFGDDFNKLQDKAMEIESVLRSIPGAAGAAAIRVNSKPYFNVELDHEALSKYGIPPRDVLDVLEHGIGGRSVTKVLEGRARFPVQVRFQAEEREDLQRLGDIIITGDGGVAVSLRDVAKLRREVGPTEIGSENGKLRATVQANVTGRDPGGFAKEALKRVQESVKLDSGMFLEWTGQYENQLHAQKTLLWIVPTAILIIYLLLVNVYRCFGEALHVLLAVPFALTGGFIFQYLMGYRFSVAVWVGYIALFGVAIQTAVVMVIYLDEAVVKMKAIHGALFNREHLREAVLQGAVLRLRPKIMTVATTVAGLLPILWSSEVGSEIMRPLAVPVVGGMLSSAVHILIITPAIFYWIRLRRLANEVDRAVER